MQKLISSPYVFKSGIFWTCISLAFLFCFLTNKYQYKFAVCAMFKNEAPWLKEWLDYHHRVLGAEHFYLYNNDSSDNFEEVLQPYIDKGIVELIDWNSSVEEHFIRGVHDVSFIPLQFGAYNDCLKKRALGKAKWVAVIDIDEFIVPVRGVKSFYSLLKKAERKSRGSLMFHWVVFGTSNVQDLSPNERLVEKLLMRAPDNHEWHKQTKCIYRPEAIKFCEVHYATKNKGYKKKVLKSNKFRVHHYWTRTESFLRERRGNYDAKEFNSVEDRTILQFISQQS